MKLLNCVILLSTILSVIPADAYRILGIFPMNAHSHFVMFKRLMKGLAERGHQVDVVSHFPLKKPFPNHNDVISLAGTLPDLVNNMTINMIRAFSQTGSETYHISSVFGTEVCALMGLPKFRELINNPPKDPPYDLVITEIFGANCYLALGQHLKAPVIGIATASLLPWVNDVVANPDNEAYIPNAFTDYSGNMNFWQRVKNTLTNIRNKWEFYKYTQSQDAQIKKYIGPHAPGVREAERNVSMVLVNSHHSLNGVRPFTTAVVEVGGLHIDERDTNLTDNLKKWLDDSGDGFVYISFGSMIKIESLPEETIAALYTSLAKLAPIRVLMKIAKPEELLPGLPDNVLTHPWIPQLAILKHKNIRVFMTHGGLMGTQEAIHCGVPLIGVPFFGDQYQNIKRYSQMNLAVALDNNQLSVETFDAAFHSVLRDPSYKEAAKTMSARFRDRPMDALDTAVFWIEYVIRNGGTNIKSPAMDLSWWQISLLDVYGFFILSTTLTVYLIIVSVKKLARRFYLNKSSPTTISKKVK